MRHPNAFYLGDRVYVDDGYGLTAATIQAFVYPRGGRQLVELEYPDGSRRRRPFSALTPAPKATSGPSWPD